MDIERAIDDEYTMTANLGRVEIPEQMKPYIIELLALRKELQQYRQIGTLDDCRATRDELIELQEYRKLGTVKECWEAREKQTPKEPDIGNDNGCERKCCPNCGCFFSPASKYCSKCGQALKWED